MSWKKMIRLVKGAMNRSNTHNTVPPSKIYTNQFIMGSDLDIGDYTYGNPIIYDYENSDAYKGPSTKIKIGKFCSIADGVAIMKGGNHNVELLSTYPFNLFHKQFKDIVSHPTTKGDITIGNDVWIGRESIILSGTSIGDGAVIGARTIVSKDVPPYTIAVGNPVRVIKNRFDEDSTQFLLDLQWWNLPEDRLKKIIPFLLSSDIDGLKMYCKNDQKSN